VSKTVPWLCIWNSQYPSALQRDFKSRASLGNVSWRPNYLNGKPLDLIKRDLLFPPVIQLGRPRRGVVRHGEASWCICLGIAARRPLFRQFISTPFAPIRGTAKSAKRLGNGFRRDECPSFRSMYMRDRVQQESQKRQGQDDKGPFPPVPLKRQKKKIPHSSDLLQVFTASR
jgi:hypothetical protein